MKRKGFTLVELLAVIVILAVIALIATPMIMDVIEKSKKSSLQDSAYGLVDAANMYYTEHIQEGIQEPIVFEFANGVQISEEKLEYKGKIQEGKLILNTNGKTVVCISDGKYYAYKDIEESEVRGGSGSCKYNGETGNFEIISDVDTLNERIKTLQEELNTLKKQGDAKAEEIKEGKTAVVQGELITGTMENASVVQIGTDVYEGTETYQIDVKPYVLNYQNLSSDSFYIRPQGLYAIGGQSFDNINLELSYDSSTGILTTTKWTGRYETGKSFVAYYYIYAFCL